MNKKRNTIIISSVIIILVIGIFLISYAYLGKRSITNTRSVVADYVSIDFSDESEDIVLSKAKLVNNDSEKETKGIVKTFKIENKGNNEATVALSLTDMTFSKNKEQAIQDINFELYLGDALLNSGTLANIGVNDYFNISTNIKLDPNKKTDTYKLIMYVPNSTSKNQDYLQGMTFSAKITIRGQLFELVQVDNMESFGTDNSGANQPDLIENSLIPVAYDDETDEWYKVSTQDNWYNYDKQVWANGVTVSLGTKDTYLSAPTGTVIKMDDIETMWVWIPRYKYRIQGEYGTHLDGTAGTQELPGAIDVVFEHNLEATGVAGTLDTAATSDYYTHPAFRNGEEVYNTEPYDLGGWDSELTGIWVGKFEMSSDCLNNNSTKTSGNCTSHGGGNVTTEKLLIKPDMKSWGNINVSNIFTVSKTLSANNNTYGINPNADSHTIKNTEWGSIAYLSQSKYGKYGNTNYTGTSKEIYKNNSSRYYTGRSQGFAPPTTANTVYGTYSYNNKSCSTEKCTTGVKTAYKGTGASNTGNIYGIYDMSGGRMDYVMGNYNNVIGKSGFISTWFTNNRKYYDKYATTNASTSYIKGDATYETSGWYNDNTIFLTASYTWFVRGGFYNADSYAGMFNYFYNVNGDAYHSSRQVLVNDSN